MKFSRSTSHNIQIVGWRDWYSNKLDFIMDVYVYLKIAFLSTIYRYNNLDNWPDDKYKFSKLYCIIVLDYENVKTSCTIVLQLIVNL